MTSRSIITAAIAGSILVIATECARCLPVTSLPPAPWLALGAVAGLVVALRFPSRE